MEISDFKSTNMLLTRNYTVHVEVFQMRAVLACGSKTLRGQRNRSDKIGVNPLFSMLIVWLAMFFIRLPTLDH